MNVVRHEDVEKDLRNLRRSSAPLESLEAWERFFSLKGVQETPGIDRFPGFSEHKIYKGRVVPFRTGIDKSCEGKIGLITQKHPAPNFAKLNNGGSLRPQRDAPIRGTQAA